MVAVEHERYEDDGDLAADAAEATARARAGATATVERIVAQVGLAAVGREPVAVAEVGQAPRACATGARHARTTEGRA